jgi:hypothetical protein
MKNKLNFSIGLTIVFTLLIAGMGATGVYHNLDIVSGFCMSVFPAFTLSFMFVR